ncbi:9584_t:CDS:1, partial [Paraglomus brasilianum]
MDFYEQTPPCEWTLLRVLDHYRAKNKTKKRTVKYFLDTISKDLKKIASPTSEYNDSQKTTAQAIISDWKVMLVFVFRKEDRTSLLGEVRRRQPSSWVEAETLSL